MSDTPLCDAFWMNPAYSYKSLENRIAGWSDFARDLERTLNSNERTLNAVVRAHDVAVLAFQKADTENAALKARIEIMEAAQ